MKQLIALLCIAAAPVAARPFEPTPIDAFLESGEAQQVPGPLSPQTKARVDHGLIAHIEQRLGVPTFFWAGRDAQPQSQSLRAQGLTPVEAARRYLLEYGELYRQEPSRLAEAKLAHVHDLGRGAVIVSFRKEVEGIRVFRDELKVIMTQDLELVALSGYLPPHQHPGVAGARTAFDLGETTAASVALQDLTGLGVENADLRDTGKQVDDYHHFELVRRGALEGLHLRSPLRTRKVLFTLPEGLEPAYYVELSVILDAPEGQVSRGYGYVVSAVDGRLLFRNNHVRYDAYSYRVWADADGHPWDGPQGNSFSPHPTGQPDGSEPALGPQTVITLQNGPLSTNDPWLPPGATSLVGNNVDAYADLGGNDGFNGSPDLRPAATTAGAAFDYSFNLALGPQANGTQIAADVTQLFVDTNFFHDWYYDYGFDEAAGNAQADNFGRGGLGGDRFLAEGQDFGGTDNANMQTPADGESPVMQMYVFKGASSQSLSLDTGSGNPQSFSTGPADFGPSTFSVTAEMAVAQSGAGLTDACSALTNNVAGLIVLADRGNCYFSQKAQNAQNAGAAGLVIINNQSGGAIYLPGSDPSVTLPTLSASSAGGTALKNAIAPGVRLTMARQAALDRDGTADNAIVAHEWGHYIQNRLIGNGNGINNNQGFGLGEGWGDFHSLLMLVREEDRARTGNDRFQAVYASATYVMTPGNNGLYFGIRRFPYSTDFSRDPLTFKHIANGVALPTTAPMSSALQGVPNSESHNTGEVWASMLWECYAALLADTPRLGFREAQDRMKLYLVGGYKSTPNSPTFLEARDAILAVAYANDPSDFGVLWAAFARRGAGQNAVAPDRASTSNSPVVEDFNSGNGLALLKADLNDSAFSCDHDGVLDNGETGRLNITLRNSGAAPLSQTTGTVTSTTPGITVLDGGALAFPASQPFTTTTATVEVKLDGAKGISPLDFTVRFSDPGVDGPPPEPQTVHFRGNANVVERGSNVDDVETDDSLWWPTYNPHFGTPTPWARTELTPTQHVWFGPDVDSPADVYLFSPALDVAQGQDLILTFKHRFDLEADAQHFYDGGVVELRASGINGWADIGALASPGYTGQLNGSPSQNPLAGRMAFSGRSAGYPDFITTTINLGQTYAGRQVRVRFRLGSDDAAAAKGWEIDDIGFSGIVGTPFTRVDPQIKVCGNHTPVAIAGDPRAAFERDTVELTGAGTDDDGDPLTYAWTQTGGSPVTLEPVDAKTVSFVAPDVASDTALSFQLVVNDGKEDSAPSPLDVVVRNAQHPPVAVIEHSGDAAPGALIRLDGSKSSDEDGDPLTFTWTQTAGPKVNLGATNASGSTASFLIPQVTEDTTIALSLVVNDGVEDSAPATLEIEVKVARVSGCGCAAGANDGSAPLWLLLLGASALFFRRRPAAFGR